MSGDVSVSGRDRVQDVALFELQATKSKIIEAIHLMLAMLAPYSLSFYGRHHWLRTLWHYP